jgi:hypothetical protein
MIVASAEEATEHAAAIPLVSFDAIAQFTSKK